MKFTGERFVPTEQGKIRIEHYHRYAFVLNMVADKAVLDVACGEGYGSALIADVAQSVVGVDLSEEAVFHARSTYGRENLTFVCGGAASLGFPDDSFDVVVSFETVEHLLEQEQMISEIRRVLRPDGFLVISSPNRPIYSEESGERNEFHVKELDFNELDSLLKSQFQQVKYCGQRILMSSVIQPLDSSPNISSVWSDTGSQLSPGAARLTDPVYFMAVCSAYNAAVPDLEMSVLYPESLDLVKHYVGFARWAKSLEKLVGERDSQISRLKNVLAERDAQVSSLTEETVRRGEWALGLNDELQEARGQLRSLLNSRSWKLTRPLRELRRLVLAPRQRAKTYAVAGARLAKRIYLAAGFSPMTRMVHRRMVARYFPRLLLVSGSPVETISGAPAHGSSRLLPLTPREIPDPSLLSVPSAENPLVSIVIPIFGKLDYTLRCLASISENPAVHPFEVIVVDDCSPDDSAGVLENVRGVRLLRNESNQGFVRTCNAGARAANGHYLYFLNNDTEVLPGWLDELVRTFEVLPGTGLVGSRLLYPDGRLQEAGGIIWRDGSAWNFGRLQNPDEPVFRYAREVDYCSGASIMLPRMLFQELGGFDEHFVPAYCEDADLALKVRAAGWRVVYQPLSTVVHHEGVTSGTDLAKGVKAYQVENSRKLFERWREVLATHGEPGVCPNQEKDRGATRRVLVLDHCTPTPDQDAGSVTTFNTLMLLRDSQFQVTFIPEDNFAYMPRYTSSLQRAGIEVLYAPYVKSVRQHLHEYGVRYDLVLLIRPGVAERHLSDVKRFCPEAKILYHVMDLHFLRMSREADVLGDSSLMQAADEMRNRELGIMNAVDMTLVHSTLEADLLRRFIDPRKVHITPLVVSGERSDVSYEMRSGIVFVGGFQHSPNGDAVKYFVAEVMPILRQRLPGVSFHVVGSGPPAEILELATADVIVEGYVQDLEALLSRMRVSVAPLRYGAGVKGKVGTAMALGLPVVATSSAVEGMQLEDEELVLVADDAKAFADAVVRVYLDSELWGRLSRNGADFAKRAWGGEAVWLNLAEALMSLGFPTVREPRPLVLYSGTHLLEEAGTSRDVVRPGVAETVVAAEGRLSSCLAPLAVVASRPDFERNVSESKILLRLAEVEGELTKAGNESFSIRGYCAPCGRESDLLVDMQSGGRRVGDRWIPNWRERLVCPTCGMNNRQRLIAGLLEQELSGRSGLKVYFMEQVTPIFAWAQKRFSQHVLFGSEYLGHAYKGGTTINGLRHEDVEDLSFVDEEIDLIVSNDVFEHVPNPDRAFAECARVLCPGGVMLATIPFYVSSDASLVRARFVDGEIEYLLPPEYHGNPVSSNGSLVFTDYGWDLFDRLSDAGFGAAELELYGSRECGHLGAPQLIFRMSK